MLLKHLQEQVLHLKAEMLASVLHVHDHVVVLVARDYGETLADIVRHPECKETVVPLDNLKPVPLEEHSRGGVARLVETDDEDSSREDNLGLAVGWQVAMKRGRRRTFGRQWRRRSRRRYGPRACLRLRRGVVEHTLLDVKHIFGYSKISYRSLAKNQERLALLLGLSNLKLFRGFLGSSEESALSQGRVSFVEGRTLPPN